MTGWVLIAVAALVGVYTYVLYPALLKVLGQRSPGRPADPDVWPRISITVPAYNEVGQIRETIESVLAIDYPEDRRQILFVSDASTDGTDDIIASYADRGVELLRREERAGKTAAENAAWSHLTGDIIINTDASIRVQPDAVKALVRRFSDPDVGVATGRDVSKGRESGDGNVGESGYVGYEMWVRDLETDAGGIVGASGSLYAIRAELHRYVLPEGLSRDFAAALVARENGYRAVSVPEATCLVPRTDSLQKEFRRKVRTMIRGMSTLRYKRHLLNPAEYGRFAWMLFSHKICRWLVPWAALAGLLGLLLLDLPLVLDVALWTGVVLSALLTALAWYWPSQRAMPRAISLPAFAVAANVAALIASVRALRGRMDAVWEPTRRPSVASANK